MNGSACVRACVRGSSRQPVPVRPRRGFLTQRCGAPELEYTLPGTCSLLSSVRRISKGAVTHPLPGCLHTCRFCQRRQPHFWDYCWSLSRFFSPAFSQPEPSGYYYQLVSRFPLLSSFFPAWFGPWFPWWRMLLASSKSLGFGTARLRLLFGSEIWVSGVLGKRVIHVQNLGNSVNFFLSCSIFCYWFLLQRENNLPNMLWLPLSIFGKRRTWDHFSLKSIILIFVHLKQLFEWMNCFKPIHIVSTTYSIKI